MVAFLADGKLSHVDLVCGGRGKMPSYQSCTRGGGRGKGTRNILTVGSSGAVVVRGWGRQSGNPRKWAGNVQNLQLMLGAAAAPPYQLQSSGSKLCKWKWNWHV